MATLLMFATEADRAALESHMLSINAFDIIRYSHHIETGTPLHVNPYKWVSLAPKDDLLMDHKDKLQYNDLDCPLIRYTAPFQYGEELCGGRLNDQEYSKTVHLTKPFMNKMRRW